MHGSLPGAEPEPDGLRTSLGLSVVVAKHLGRTLSRIGEEPLQRLGSPYVQRPTPIVRQALVGDLLYERMLERVPPRCAGCDLVNELCGLQVVETTRQISLLQPGNRGQHGHGDVTAGHRCYLQDIAILGGEPVEAAGDNAVDGAGNGQAAP